MSYWKEERPTKVLHLFSNKRPKQLYLNNSVSWTFVIYSFCFRYFHHGYIPEFAIWSIFMKQKKHFTTSRKSVNLCSSLLIAVGLFFSANCNLWWFVKEEPREKKGIQNEWSMTYLERVSLIQVSWQLVIFAMIS